MTWSIAVAGTVHDDDLTTPAGPNEHVLGGSAVFFALAASHYGRVHLNGIVGADTVGGFRELLARSDVSLDGLVVSDLPTFRWHARHDFEQWVAVDTWTEEGCDPLWQPVLAPASAAAGVMFIASMRPSIQAAVLEQSRARLVGADSMVDYTHHENDAVHHVARGADILFLNRTELASLVGGEVHDWADAARSLCGRDRLRAVVVKAGPLGAACVTAGTVIERGPAPVAAVVDPTGAGDALAGGFLGACARAERDDDAFFATALDEGLRWAARAISAFGTDGLRSP